MTDGSKKMREALESSKTYIEQTLDDSCVCYANEKCDACDNLKMIDEALSSQPVVEGKNEEIARVLWTLPSNRQFKDILEALEAKDAEKAEIQAKLDEAVRALEWIADICWPDDAFASQCAENCIKLAQETLAKVKEK